MTKEQSKRDLYNNPEKTAFAMRPESETVYGQVCKVQEQTNNWEDEWDEITQYSFAFKEELAIKLTGFESPSSLKKYIKKIISQENQKWNKALEDVIKVCTPLYIEGESRDFTEGQEYTIRQFQKYFNLLNK